MGVEIEKLFSAVAGDGPPLFFPNPEVPAIFNFDQGLAAPESFPKEDLIRLTKLVLDRDGPDVLDYFDPATGYEELVFGYRKLRARLAGRIKARQGRDLGSMGVILTSGSVQGISLAVNGFVNPGDVVLVEASSFPYALRYMAMAGADVRAVPIDHRGMEVEAIAALLEQIAAEGKRVKMVYTIPPSRPRPTARCRSRVATICWIWRRNTASSSSRMRFMAICALPARICRRCSAWTIAGW